MGSKKSSSTSQNTTNQYDQRAITTIDDRDTYSSWDMSDRSTSNYDLSDRSTSSIAYDSSNRSTSSYQLDSSNRSTTNTTINATDPGAVRLGELNAQFLGAAAGAQSDAVKAVAGLGAEAFRDLSATSANTWGANERAWSHTVDAASGVIDKLLTNAQGSTDAARAIAGAAISSYQPAESKAGDALKWGAIAAAVIGGVLLMKA